MFISLYSKGALPRLARPAASAVNATRGFIFSARAKSETSSKAESGWTGAGGAEPAGQSTASASSAASSTAYNYDQAAFGKFLDYQVAVAFQPKDRKDSNVFRKRQQKSPAQLSASGEDNLFVSVQAPDGSFAVGVADGVGGWSEAGYDSSAISRELCHSLKTGFEAGGSRGPRDLLVAAFNDVQSSPKVEIGGTTACLGVITPDKKLRVANLGDSWCGVFRDHQLVHETSFQTHNFNTPFQLAKIPKQILRQAELQGKRYIIDSPDMADEYVWDLKKNDVVIFATDGVTDNVVPQEMEVFLKDHDAKGSDLATASKELVKEVVKVSKDPNFPSAFAQELSRLTGQKYLGGKEDDVTIVMVKVL